MGKFPVAVRANEKIEDKIGPMSKNIKVSLKFKIGMPMCLSAPIGNIDMPATEIEANTIAAVNFVLTLMKKGWQNVKKIHLKSTMGPSFTVYGFTITK